MGSYWIYMSHMSMRQARGKDLARKGKVSRTGRHTWRVESSDGSKNYTITDWQDRDNRFECTCYDYRKNKSSVCKHISAVKFILVRDEFGLDLIGGDL
jgi:uncharacterized Zn finger protein